MWMRRFTKASTLAYRLVMGALLAVLAVLPVHTSDAQEASYLLGVAVSGEHACRVQLFDGAQRPPDGTTAAFDRVLKPGESAVVPFAPNGFWWHHTIGTWATDRTELTFVGSPRKNRRGGAPPRVTWLQVRN
jgi:hypothetical protein